MSGDIKKVKTSRGELSCFGVLLGRRCSSPQGGISGGRGISGKRDCLLRHLRRGIVLPEGDVFVIGGGFAAAEESVFLTKYARHVTSTDPGKGLQLCGRPAAEPALEP